MVKSLHNEVNIKFQSAWQQLLLLLKGQAAQQFDRMGKTTYRRLSSGTAQQQASVPQLAEKEGKFSGCKLHVYSFFGCHFA